jgi:hypothetical protein
MTGSRFPRLLAGLAVLVALSAEAPNAIPAPIPVITDRWEYAELQRLDVPQSLGPNGDLVPAGMLLRWATPEDEIIADSWDGFSKKLRTPNRDQKATYPADRLRVFNQLGAEGWELAAYTPGTQAEPRAWTFKRKVRR